jgi:hypothetical protein
MSAALSSDRSSPLRPSQDRPQPSIREAADVLLSWIRHRNVCRLVRRRHGDRMRRSLRSRAWGRGRGRRWRRRDRSTSRSGAPSRRPSGRPCRRTAHVRAEWRGVLVVLDLLQPSVHARALRHFDDARVPAGRSGLPVVRGVLWRRVPAGPLRRGHAGVLAGRRSVHRLARVLQQHLRPGGVRQQQPGVLPRWDLLLESLPVLQRMVQRRRVRIRPSSSTASLSTGR